MTIGSLPKWDGNRLKYCLRIRFKKDLYSEGPFLFDGKRIAKHKEKGREYYTPDRVRKIQYTNLIPENCCW